MTVKEHHSPVRFFFSRAYMVHPGCDSPRQAWSALRSYCEAPAKVSSGSRTLVCIKGFIFSHFSGKASAGAPDTRDGEAPSEKCKYIYIYIYIYN